MKLNGKLVAGAVVLGLMTTAAIVSSLSPAADHHEAVERSLTERARDLYLKNEAWGDPYRNEFFRQAAEKMGQRCDSVERAIMGTPGAWVVACAPGYRYRYTFDQDGQPLNFARLP